MKRLGSCESCHFHSSGIAERCNVYFFGKQCEGYIRECCCGGAPVASWRNEPAPRHPPTQPTEEQAMTSNETTDPWLAEAVEVGARAAYVTARHLMAFPTDFEGAPVGIQDTYRKLARAAILAALPAITEAIAAAIEDVAADPDRRRPLDTDAEFPTDLANDFKWCASIARSFGSQVAR